MVEIPEMIEALVDHESIREDQSGRGIVTFDEVGDHMVAAIDVLRCQIFLLVASFEQLELCFQV